MALDPAQHQRPDAESRRTYPGWYHALTLRERLALLRQEATRLPELETGDAIEAEHALHAWKAQPPFDQEPFWAERLAMEGISGAELAVLLGERSETGWARLAEPPAWIDELEHIFAQPLEGADLAWLDEVFTSSDEGAAGMQHSDEASLPAQSFLPVFSPLLARGVARFQSGLTTLLTSASTPPFDPAAVARLLLPALVRQLLQQATRTLTLELHVARLEGRLSGETPEERFGQFVTQLRHPEHLWLLLTEYGPLARLLIETLQRWVASSLEVIQHLCTDWEEICRELASGEDPGTLCRVTAGVGDLHQGGKSTLILQFTSGWRLVYKPRSLAVDLHFQQLLADLNARGAHPPFRLLRVLDKGDHGWSEYVAHTSCTTREEVARFYERQGGYLALLYVLEATDFHYENLIAAGEHPLLVDLEALFHPRPLEAEQATQPRVRWEMLANSVHSVGLLPHRLWGTQERMGIDISGLGGHAGQLSPLPTLQVQGRGTDQMMFVREYREIGAAHNQPFLQGQAVDLLEYREDLLRGFRQIYRLCQAQAEALIAGPLQACAQDPIRVILRATSIYALLLAESLHPDLLRDALARDRFFDHLWMQAMKQPQLKPLIAYERDALHAGDIPLFRSHPETRDLWTADGRCLPDFLVASSLETVNARLRALSEADLARQCWIIEAALATRSMGEASGSGGSHLVPTKVQATPARLVRAACAVGDRLGTLALPGAPGITWLGVNYVYEREWRLAPAGLDLYDGVSGIAFFLAYLGALTGSEHYTRLARAALLQVQELVQERLPLVQAPGGVGGWGSLLYLSAHLGVLWQEDALLEEAAAYAALVPDLLEKDQALDLIGGVAGTILCLLALYQTQPRKQVLEVAMCCGDWLLAQAAQCQPAHLPTYGAGMEPRPLTGLSHGAAGMALGLAKLAAISKAPRFRAGALAALAYERSVFSEARQNWPDFRMLTPGHEGSPQAGTASDPPQEHFAVTWCHGAPGIGLARLAMLPSLGNDPALHQEIASALETTIKHGFGGNHSLCHGDLGNLETVLAASRILKEPGSAESLTRLTAEILNSIEAQGWVTGVPLGVETPGLMTGLAGIGYELLRLAEPERVPSVLSLAPPLVTR